MSMRAKLLILLTVSGLMASAATITWSGPTTPAGVLCNPTDPGCVIGSSFAVYGVQLTQPSLGNPNWTLKIEMDYPNNPTPMTAGNIIPPELWEDGLLYSIADFLISWNGKDYGVVLAQHIQGGVAVDTYQAGNLYQAPNIPFNKVLSGQVPPAPPGVLPFGSPRPSMPVWLAPGGTLLGTGTVSVALGGAIFGKGKYTVTDVFSAPADFLSTGTFSIIADSYVCANGLIVGNGSFTGGGGGDVPEPGTFALVCIPALLLFGRRFVSKFRA